MGSPQSSSWLASPTSMSEAIAFLGSTDTVKGFLPLGVRPYPVETREAALEALKDCLRRKVAIVVVAEEIAQVLEHELRALRFCPTPAILVVPSMTMASGMGMERLRSLVEKAVGADILSRESPAGAGKGMGE